MDSELHKKIFSKNQDAILFQGLDHCIIGIDNKNRVVYSYSKILNHLIHIGMDEKTAVEWINKNIFNKYSNDKGPLVLFPF